MAARLPIPLIKRGNRRAGHLWGDRLEQSQGALGPFIMMRARLLPLRFGATKRRLRGPWREDRSKLTAGVRRPRAPRLECIALYSKPNGALSNAGSDLLLTRPPMRMPRGEQSGRYLIAKVIYMPRPSTFEAEGMYARAELRSR